MGKECVPQVPALCWRAHTDTLCVGRWEHLSPVRRKDNALKVLPRVASWAQFDELAFVIITCHLSGSPYGREGQEQISWLCWSKKQQWQFQECLSRFKNNDVMLMGSLEQRGLDSATHSDGSAGILPQVKPLTFLHTGTQLQTGDNDRFSLF